MFVAIVVSIVGVTNVAMFFVLVDLRTRIERLENFQMGRRADGKTIAA